MKCSETDLNQCTSSEFVGSVVVMGVSGSGKSTIGSMLGVSLGVTFIEADDLHSDDKKAMMAAGISLTDDDRWPWLSRVASSIGDLSSSVCACSALKRRYRDVLRATRPEIIFVELHGSREQIARRLASRSAHFMSRDLIDAQIATLEPLQSDEVGFRVAIDGDSKEIVASIVSELENLEGTRGT